MHFLLALFLAVVAYADDSVDILHETPVYKTAAPGARVLFYLHQGERASTAPSSNGNFVRVKGKYKGKNYVGFVAKADLSDGEYFSNESKASETQWGFGAGLEYVSLMQKGKSFQTEDQVQYTTEDYKSTSIAPFLTVQMNQVDFWRLTFAQKKTRFTSSATTNLVGSKPKEIDLQQTFYSLLLQKAWMPLHAKSFYVGFGAEVAKATAVSLSLGSSVLPTTSSDMPTYIGGMLFGGGRLSLNHSLTMYAEGRLEYIANQSPGILDGEITIGLLYWP